MNAARILDTLSCALPPFKPDVLYATGEAGAAALLDNGWIKISVSDGSGHRTEKFFKLRSRFVRGVVSVKSDGKPDIGLVNSKQSKK